MTQSFHVHSPSEESTSRLADCLAQSIHSPMAILLSGDVGTGKSHMSRALIRNWANAELDVPSPTFTIVQSYETPKGGIWHVDLYRLGDVQELVEIGLLEALESNLCLIEWPELALDFITGPRLDISITAQGDTRDITFTATSEILQPIIDNLGRTPSFCIIE